MPPLDPGPAPEEEGPQALWPTPVCEQVFFFFFKLKNIYILSELYITHGARTQDVRMKCLTLPDCTRLFLIKQAAS